MCTKHFLLIPLNPQNHTSGILDLWPASERLRDLLADDIESTMTTTTMTTGVTRTAWPPSLIRGQPNTTLCILHTMLIFLSIPRTANEWKTRTRTWDQLSREPEPYQLSRAALRPQPQIILPRWSNYHFIIISCFALTSGVPSEPLIRNDAHCQNAMHPNTFHNPTANCMSWRS